MKTLRNILVTVQHLWVAPSQSDMVTKPIAERLRDLHDGLRQVHAGLWINTKPGEPRFRSKQLETRATAYLVVFNHRATEAQVLEVAQGFGFALVQDLELVPNLRVSTVTTPA